VLDKGHSQIIIILLGGILAVLLFGREATLGSIETAFWVGLVFGIVALVVWAIAAFVRYMAREAKAYRDQVRRDRAEGRPWLYTFVAWPGFIGNLGVFAVAAYSRYVEASCKAFTGDCLQQIPYWWFPITLFAASIPVAVMERIVLYFRRRRAS
jgi:hypothetical protein